MNRKPDDTREIRRFGLIALLFFGILSMLGILMDKMIPFFLFGILCMLGLGFILFPYFFRSVYKIWLKISHFVSTMLNIFLLSMAYYMAITPTALIKRLFGGRPLPVKPEREKISYWIFRDEQSQTVERYLKRY